MMNTLSIGEVAAYAGIQTSAIRYYESEGLLPPPRRVSGHRRYDADVLKRLGLIQLLRQAGFGIREMQALFGVQTARVAADGHTEPAEHQAAKAWFSAAIESQCEDEQAATPWQALVTRKVAELDALIEQNRAARAWLLTALQSGCEGVEDCVVVTYDDSGGSMQVTLACLSQNPQDEAKPSQAVRLMTLPAAPEM